MSLTANPKNPLFMLQCWGQALQLLLRPELRKFIVLPILVNIVIYSLALGLGYYYVSGWVTHFIPDSLAWLSWILWPILFISFVVLMFFSFTLLANILLAPFYGVISERTEALISGEAVMVHNIPLLQSWGSECKRLWYLLKINLPLLLLSLIPGINLIVALLWMLVGSWSMALEYMAYPMDNAGILFVQQKQQLQSARLTVLMFGGIVLLGLMLPILNFLMPVLAVICATVYWKKSTL